MSPVDTMTDRDIFEMRFKMNFTNTVSAVGLILSICISQDTGVWVCGLGLIGRAVVDLVKAMRGCNGRSNPQ